MRFPGFRPGLYAVALSARHGCGFHISIFQFFHSYILIRARLSRDCACFNSAIPFFHFSILRFLLARFHSSTLQSFHFLMCLSILPSFHSSIFQSSSGAIYIIRCTLWFSLDICQPELKKCIYFEKSPDKIWRNGGKCLPLHSLFGRAPVEFRGRTDERPYGSSLNGLDKTE